MKYQKVFAKENIWIVVVIIIAVLLIYLFYKHFKRILDIRDLPRNARGCVFKAIVMRVGDGDGFRAVHTPFLRLNSDIKRIQTLPIRLAGIDAPEMRHFDIPAQPYAKEATGCLKNLILHKKVCISVLSIDMYQRILAIVHVKTGMFSWDNVNVKMVEKGMACVYDRAGAEYGGIKDLLLEAEMKAKKAKLGMWKNKGGILPMDYKRQAKQNNKYVCKK